MRRFAGVAEAETAASPAFEGPAWRVISLQTPWRPMLEEVARAEAEAAEWRKADADGRVYERFSVRYTTYVAERMRQAYTQPAIPSRLEDQLDAFAAEHIYPSREFVEAMRAHDVADASVAHAARLAESLPARCARAHRRAGRPHTGPFADMMEAIRTDAWSEDQMRAVLAELEPIADAHATQQARDASLDAAGL